MCWYLQPNEYNGVEIKLIKCQIYKNESLVIQAVSTKRITTYIDIKRNL